MSHQQLYLEILAVLRSHWQDIALFAVTPTDILHRARALGWPVLPNHAHDILKLAERRAQEDGTLVTEEIDQTIQSWASRIDWESLSASEIGEDINGHFSFIWKDSSQVRTQTRFCSLAKAACQAEEIARQTKSDVHVSSLSYTDPTLAHFLFTKKGEYGE
ncbi:hypothetical protein D6833_07215 [Candidatus Parcubacteria bacterium]|nr:MAG: hypothetical protein D6833_07215 [Candidatus Parcubacteria bacterium]